MRVIILIAIVTVAVVAGFGMLWVSNQNTKPATQAAQAAPAPQAAGNVATTDVYVARKDLPLGTLITEDMVDRQPWPRNLVIAGYMPAGVNDVSPVGRVTRSELKAREPFMASKISGENDTGYLAGTLGEGMRAVTLAVDPISGVAGYVMPGDRVDIVFAHSVPQSTADGLWSSGSSGGWITIGGGGGSLNAMFTEVMLSNVRVLAINTRRPAQPQGRNGQPAAEIVEPPSNVTVELNLEDVNKLRLAERKGTLSLALRSVKDRDAAGDIGPVINGFDISRQEGKPEDTRGWAAWSSSRSTPNAGPDGVYIIRGTTAGMLPAVAGAGAPIGPGGPPPMPMAAPGAVR